MRPRGIFDEDDNRFRVVARIDANLSLFIPSRFIWSIWTRPSILLGFPLGPVRIRETMCPTCKLSLSMSYAVGVELPSPAGRDFAAIAELVLSSIPPS